MYNETPGTYTLTYIRISSLVRPWTFECDVLMAPFVHHKTANCKKKSHILIGFCSSQHVCPWSHLDTDILVFQIPCKQNNIWKKIVIINDRIILVSNRQKMFCLKPCAIFRTRTIQIFTFSTKYTSEAISHVLWKIIVLLAFWRNLSKCDHLFLEEEPGKKLQIEP